jgi:hypothetical protein
MGRGDVHCKRVVNARLGYWKRLSIARLLAADKWRNTKQEQKNSDRLSHWLFSPEVKVHTPSTSYTQA